MLCLKISFRLIIIIDSVKYFFKIEEYLVAKPMFCLTEKNLS